MALSIDPITSALVDLALQEDLSAGDVTTDSLLDPCQEGVAALVAPDTRRHSGQPEAAEVFRRVDPSLRWQPQAADGDQLSAGQVAATIGGSVRSILIAERTALNFVRHLCGVATQASRFVLAAGSASVRIVDTRKTTPGMRRLEKAAVRHGGAHNHRFALGDGVLIKDNHLAACGSVRAALESARAGAHHLLKLEVEVTCLEQLDEAIAAGADVVLLDNMSPAEVAAAVHSAAGRVVLEASGNVRLDTVRAYAATGVDVISSGALTHSAPNADLALDLRPTHTASG